MTISTLIRKGRLAKVATATPTTQQAKNVSNVAKVATVVVANHPALVMKEKEETAICARYAQIEDTNQNIVSSSGRSCAQDELSLRLEQFGISIKEIASEAENDWSEIKDDSAAIVAFASLLYDRQLMKQGLVPPSYTTITRCEGCGKVHIPPSLTNNGHVWGCPWCWNKANDWPIPSPLT